MLNSPVNEISISHKTKMLKNNGISCLKLFDGVFIRLMNVKMPTVDINELISFLYILRRKKLVNTDTVCNNFVRQS